MANLVPVMTHNTKSLSKTKTKSQESPKSKDDTKKSKDETRTTTKSTPSASKSISDVSLHESENVKKAGKTPKSLVNPQLEYIKRNKGGFFLLCLFCTLIVASIITSTFVVIKVREQTLFGKNLLTTKTIHRNDKIKKTTFPPMHKSSSSKTDDLIFSLVRTQGSIRNGGVDASSQDIGELCRKKFSNHCLYYASHIVNSCHHVSCSSVMLKVVISSEERPSDNSNQLKLGFGIEDNGQTNLTVEVPEGQICQDREENNLLGICRQKRCEFSDSNYRTNRNVPVDGHWTTVDHFAGNETESCIDFSLFLVTEKQRLSWRSLYNCAPGVQAEGCSYHLQQRFCANPPPSYGGKPCFGATVDNVLLWHDYPVILKPCEENCSRENFIGIDCTRNHRDHECFTTNDQPGESDHVRKPCCMKKSDPGTYAIGLCLWGLCVPVISDQ